MRASGLSVSMGNKRSPEETVALNNGGLDVKVVYFRPYKKERQIFGCQANCGFPAMRKLVWLD